MGHTKNYGLLGSKEAFKRGLEKRVAQLETIDKYMADNKDVRLQINFCKMQSEDHACITVSGRGVWSTYQEVRKHILKQIKELEDKLSLFEES